MMRPGTPQGDVSSRGCAPPVEIRAPDQLALIRAGGNSCCGIQGLVTARPAVPNR